MTIWSHGTRFDGTTINVSEGGMYFFAAAGLTIGDVIELEFYPAGAKEPVCVSGVVCRRALYLYAIEFTRTKSVATHLGISEPDSPYELR